MVTIFFHGRPIASVRFLDEIPVGRAPSFVGTDKGFITVPFFPGNCTPLPNPMVLVLIFFRVVLLSGLKSAYQHRKYVVFRLLAIREKRQIVSPRRG